MDYRLLLLTFAIIFVSTSCVTAPEKEEIVVIEDKIEQPVIEEKEVEAPVEETVETEGFVVTKDYFETTFEDINEIISQLNEIILAGEFDEWKKALTPNYIAHFSSEQVLQEISEQPLMQKYNIRLRSLEDYFFYVVAPSRKNARLDDLVFIDDTHVKALMFVDEKPTILYYLERMDNSWKIAVFEK